MHWLSKKSTKIIMIMPAVILFTVFYLAPIFISVYYSFTDFSGIGAAKFIGFKNYQVLLKDKFFFIALKNTFIILIGITITILPLSFIVALLLAPNVIAPILVGLIWLFILDPKMGMINAILRSIGLSDYQQQWIGGKTLTPYSVAFVYLWQVLGFYTTINMAGLRSIPADIYEAAEIDGANYFQRIRKITMPMMKNTIVINTILIITGGFKIFETVKQLTNGGPNHMSDVLVTYMYDTTFTSSRYGYGMAVATVSFVLCLIFSIIYLVNVGKSLEQKEG